MKGIINELIFLVNISEDEGGAALATANFELDQTPWGITAGSDSFFDNLAEM